MTYSIELEKRIDHLMQKTVLDKKKMFGGICYLLDGNICFGIHKESLVTRTTADIAAKMMEDNYFLPFDITGRPMKGGVMIKGDWLDDCRLKEALGFGTDLAGSLPKK